MFWNLVLVEHQRLSRRWLLAIELIILILLIAGMSIIMYAVVPALPESNMPVPLWSDALTTMLQIACMPLIGGVLTVTLVGAVTAQAYQWRTMHLWISHGAPRGTLLTAKVLALLLALLLFPLVTLLVSAPVTAALLTRLDGATVNASDIALLPLLASLLRGMLSLLPYAALALLLAIVTRSPVLPIGGGIGFIVVESLLTSLLGSLGSPTLARLTLLLPSGLASSLMQANQMTAATTAATPSATGGPGGMATADPWLALAGIICWTLALLLPAFWLFRNQDLSG
jgi:ABC-type transport system involved in multi-copper enzyme maturation permease subunit